MSRFFAALVTAAPFGDLGAQPLELSRSLPRASIRSLRVRCRSMSLVSLRVTKISDTAASSCVGDHERRRPLPTSSVVAARASSHCIRRRVAPEPAAHPVAPRLRRRARAAAHAAAGAARRCAQDSGSAGRARPRSRRFPRPWPQRRAAPAASTFGGSAFALASRSRSRARIR